MQCLNADYILYFFDPFPFIQYGVYSSQNTGTILDKSNLRCYYFLNRNTIVLKEKPMHMADALLSPEVGGVMWVATAGAIAFSAQKLKKQADPGKIPLMGVMGAFIFAAQMINFAIPGTGSSGHIGGGMILVMLLGPSAGFLTIASVLIVQAVFFADGGLLALGCNIFNMGVIPCFLTFPLIYKKFKDNKPYSLRSMAAIMAAVIIALQLGAFSVVLETVFSGVSGVGFYDFLLLMQPIHLAIGVVEGLITIAVINFLAKARPDLIEQGPARQNEQSAAVTAPTTKKIRTRIIIAIVLGMALLTAGIVSWFASSDPDGLEWAFFHTTGKEEPSQPQDDLHRSLQAIQETTAVLPDYNFKNREGTTAHGETAEPATVHSSNNGTSLAGIVGSLLTLVLITSAALLLKIIRKPRTRK